MLENIRKVIAPFIIRHRFTRSRVKKQFEISGHRQKLQSFFKIHPAIHAQTGKKRVCFFKFSEIAFVQRDFFTLKLAAPLQSQTQ